MRVLLRSFAWLLLAACGTTAPPATCPYTERVFIRECRGAAPMPMPMVPGATAVTPTPTPTPVAICQPCLVDAHCTERASGHCITPSITCGTPQRICQYPGDPCDPARCTANCVWSAPGRVECTSALPNAPP